MPQTSLTHFETEHDGIVFGYQIDRIVCDTVTSRGQHVQIFDTPAYGRVLVMDGETQSASIDQELYHEVLVHPAMWSCPSPPKRVLILGGGEMATAREVLKHPSVEHCTVMEWDREAVDLCLKHLAWDSQAHKDPRTNIMYEDAGVYIMTRYPNVKFDVIIIDICDPNYDDREDQANQFYCRAFYRRLRSEWLTANGVLVTQCGDACQARWVRDECETVFCQDGGSCRMYGCFLPTFAAEWGFVLASPLAAAAAATAAATVDKGSVQLKASTAPMLTHMLQFDYCERPALPLRPQPRKV
jgi:spermidine synthase